MRYADVVAVTRSAGVAPTNQGGVPALWCLVLAGGVVMGLALGIRHVQGLFFLPVTMAHGWTRETFALAMAIQNLTWGVTQPLAGMVADRFGAAKVIAAGMVCYALGLWFMVQAQTPAAFIWGAGVCMGVALSGTAFAAVYGALSRLVGVEQRSWALGATGAVGGLVQFAMVPAAQGLLGREGWVVALWALAMLMLLCLPLTRLLREPETPLVRGGAALSLTAAIREAGGHRGFWLLNVGFLACGFQLSFIGTHLPAYLLDKGLRAVDTVAALALIALANVLGCYVCGELGARYRRKDVLAAIYLLRTFAMALFLLCPLSMWSVGVFASVMGFVWLGTVPLTNGLVSQIFGVRYISTLFGFVFLGHQIGSFGGVWLGGRVFESTRSYDFIWYGAMGLGVLAAVLHWFIDDAEVQRPSSTGVAS